MATEREPGEELETRVKTDLAETQAPKQAQKQEAGHVFTLRTGKREHEFTDAKKAGAAYYRADPEKTPRPSVVHAEGNRGRIIASTEIQGTDESGQIRYYKSLPDVMPIDKEFQAGYYEASQTALRKHLRTLKTETEQGQKAPKQLEKRIADELERFAGYDSAKALKLWQKYAPDGIQTPTYLTEHATSQESKPAVNDQKQVENVIEFYDRTQDITAQKAKQAAPVTAEATEQTRGDAEGNNPIPERLASRYLRVKNKYYFQDKTLAFEDGGKKLKVETENFNVIRDAIAIAEDRNWQTIKISGSDNFKHQAWKEAALRGIEVIGYKPTEIEQAEVAKILADRYKNPAGADKGQQTSATLTQPDGVINGTLINHGRAPYKHEKDKKESYYVTLNNAGQERTYWGVDFERAIGESQTSVAIGDTIKMRNMGQNDVAVMVNIYDDNKKKIGEEEKIVQRNTWLVEKAERFDEILKKEIEEPAQVKRPAASQLDVNSQEAPGGPTVETKTQTAAPASRNRDGMIVGTLLDHGPDYYKHDPNQGKSYFVKLKVDGKEVTKWGTDFKRAFKESQSKPEVGDKIIMESAGQQEVNIGTKERDANGNEVERKKPVKKNTWRVEREDYQTALENQAQALRTGREIESNVIRQMPQVAEAITAAKLGEKIAEQAHQSGVIKTEDEKEALVYIIREGLASALEKGKKISAPEVREQGRQATIDANNVLNDQKPPVATKEPVQKEMVR